ncbi:WD40 repeat domain-containing serine/threonine protein kinase [Streptomyces sp. NPDC058000]|uniref:WD40 repeat domain-containing serine/threonine protein kinase n=1 Tax=Streptomyces sp. NPDC058000 TaxID=3346299 RepID=UPI0036F0F37E
MIGPYRLFAELGSGAMGRVLLAEAPDGQLVAVKRVREHFLDADGFRVRFRREAEAARAVSGAHTAAVLDADADAPIPWLAAEFVPGVSLREAVDIVGGLPEEAVLRLAAGLASALTAIHRTGLVHRDLKPSNVILAPDGPKVTDFHVVRATDSAGGSDLTPTGWPVGSPGFMAPEQVEGGRFTPRSDVFSLGAVLVAACLGKGPFAGASTPHTLYNVVHTEPDLDMIPDRLRGIIEPCLAKDPVRRPTPDQLLESIGQIAPSTQPWPPSVHTLIARRDADVARLLEATPEPPGGREADAGDGADVGARGRRGTRRVRWPSALVGLPVLLTGIVIWTLWPSLQGSGGGGGRPATASAGSSASPHGSSSRPATTPTGHPPVTLFGHDSYITGVAFSPDGRTLLTGSNDGTARLWDLASRRQSGRPLTVGPLGVSSVAFSPDGRTVATGDEDGTARLWNATSHRQLARLLTIGPHAVQSVAFSPDGRTLAAGSDHGETRLWDVASRQQLGQPLGRSPFAILNRVVFSPDGHTLATAGSDGTVRLWDVASHQQLGQPLGHFINTTTVAFSPDGRTLAAGDWDHTTRLWDVASHQQLAKFQDTSVVTWVAFSPDGRTLATVNTYQVRLWDTSRHRQLGQIQSGAVSSPECVEFSPDGHTLALGTADDDGAVELWDVKSLSLTR